VFDYYFFNHYPDISVKPHISLDNNESEQSMGVNQFKQSGHINGKNSKHHVKVGNGGGELSGENFQSDQLRLDENVDSKSLENGYVLHGRGARSNLTRIENANLLLLESGMYFLFENINL
jgi:hypothetical protein